MYRIGAIDIDTSHPVEFAGIMRDSGRGQYTCVYNTGFRDDDYVNKFMIDNEIAVCCETLDEMINLVDVAFIHNCNWDRHIELARPFIEAGKPVFIDKPVVGSVAECVKLQQLADKGVQILGGSAFRFCQELKEFIDRPVAQRGEIMFIFGTTGVDEFNYGIHVIEAFGCFIPNGAESVRFLHDNGIQSFQINYENDVYAVYQICPGLWRNTRFAVTTTKDTYFITPDINLLYKNLLNRVFDSLEGVCPYPNAEELIESIRISLAGLKSRQLKGRKVRLKELDYNCPAYDGDIFEKFYAEANSKRK